MMRHGSLRLRFLRSMLLIVVPVIVFCLIFNQIGTQNLSIYIEQQYLNINTQTASQISMLFLKLRSAASQDLTGLLGPDSSYLSEEAFATVLKRGESIIGDRAAAYLYLRGDEYVYSGTGRMHYTGFTAQYKDDYDFEMSGFFTSLNSCMSERILPVSPRAGSGSPGGIAFISPIYIGTKPVADLFFLIPYATFDALLKDCLGTLQCNFHILNDRLDVIFSRKLDAGLAYDEAFLKQQQGIGVIQKTLEGQNLVSVRSLDPDNGLTYLCVYRHSVFFAALRRNSTNVWLLSGVLMAVVVVLSLLIVQWNYSPIKKTFISLFDTLPGGRGTNELDYLMLRWEQTRERQKDLVLQLDEQKQLVREQLATKLIYGRIAGEDEYQYLLRCADVRFKESFFFAMYINPGGGEPGARIHQELEEIEGFRPEGAETIFTVPLHAPGICLLMNFSSRQGREPGGLLSEYAQALCDYLKSKDITNAKIGVGSLYPQAMRLNYSFHEAVVALRAGPLMQNERFTLYEPSLANSLNAASLSSAPEKYLFLEGIDNADVTVARSALQSIAERFRESMDSYLQFQFCVYDLCHSLMELMGRYGIAQFNERIMKLPVSESFAAFQETMHPFVQELCDAVREKQQAADIQMRTRLLNYIHEHYTEVDFSQDMVIGALGISRTKSNTILMEDMGTSFSQYTSGLRMAEFKQQLRETDKQVKDIVHDIGYLDVSNFLRKFKTINGMTAGQYRALSKGRSEPA